MFLINIDYRRMRIPAASLESGIFKKKGVGASNLLLLTGEVT